VQGPVVQGPGFVQKPDGEGDTSCKGRPCRSRSSCRSRTGKEIPRAEAEPRGRYLVQKPDGEGDTSCRSQAGHTRTSKGTEHRTCTHRHSDNYALKNPSMPDQLPGRATRKFLYILPPLLMGMSPFPGRQSSAKPLKQSMANG